MQKTVVVTSEILVECVAFLRDDDKSDATIGKYMRDVFAFLKFAGRTTVTRRLVLAYKDVLTIGATNRAAFIQCSRLCGSFSAISVRRSA